MTAGERYAITVKHDTYGLSFSLRSDAGTVSLLPTANGFSQAPTPVLLYVRLQLSQTCACFTVTTWLCAKDLHGASSCLPCQSLGSVLMPKLLSRIGGAGPSLEEGL